MTKPDIVERWNDYVESMGSVMGEAENLAQDMSDEIERLRALTEWQKNLLINAGDALVLASRGSLTDELSEAIVEQIRKPPQGDDK